MHLKKIQTLVVFFCPSKELMTSNDHVIGVWRPVKVRPLWDLYNVSHVLDLPMGPSLVLMRFHARTWTLWAYRGHFYSATVYKCYPSLGQALQQVVTSYVDTCLTFGFLSVDCVLSGLLVMTSTSALRDFHSTLCWNKCILYIHFEHIHKT
jgi:hypothetical protein